MEQVYIIDGVRVLVEGPYDNEGEGPPAMYVVKRPGTRGGTKIIDAATLEEFGTEVNLKEYVEGKIYTNGKELALITKTTDTSVTVQFKTILDSPFQTRVVDGGDWTIPKAVFALNHVPFEVQIGDTWIDSQKVSHSVARTSDSHVILGFPSGAQVSKVGLFSNYFLLRDGGVHAVQE